MATIVNTPTTSQDPSGNIGFLLGLLLLIVLVLMFWNYGLPALNRVSQPPTINVPDQVDVNIDGQINQQPQPNQ